MSLASLSDGRLVKLVAGGSNWVHGAATEMTGADILRLSEPRSFRRPLGRKNMADPRPDRAQVFCSYYNKFKHLCEQPRYQETPRRRSPGPRVWRYGRGPCGRAT